MMLVTLKTIYSGAWSLVYLALIVVTLAAYWKMFTKAGEKGWKAIIPFYSSYVLYKLVWKTSMFWVTLVIGVIMWVCGAGFFGAMMAAYGGVGEAALGGMALASMVIFVALAIVTFVISILLYVKMAKAYGYGGGFAVGLLFLNTIFVLILGFGNARYIGPQNEK